MNKDHLTTLRAFLDSEQFLPINPTRLTSLDLVADLDFLKTVLPNGKSIGPLDSIGGSITHFLTEQPANAPFQWQLLHGYTSLIRGTVNIPGGQSLVARLPSHRGFENQLFVTYFLRSNCQVTAVEDGILDVEADIAMTVSGKTVYVEVKTIDQSSKQRNLLNASVDAFMALSEGEAIDSKGRGLAIPVFEGVVPDGLTPEFWRKALLPLPTQPEDRHVDLGGGYSVRMRIDWNDGHGQVLGVDHFRNIDAHMAKAERQAPVASTGGALFVAAVPPEVLWSLRKVDPDALKGHFWDRDVLGVLFISCGVSTDRFCFERFPMLATKHTGPSIQKLDSQLPTIWDVPYEEPAQ